MDSVDKVTWILPFLALLDVSSTFYLGNLGYSLSQYEQGFFASLFVSAGIGYAYIYAVVYLLTIIGLAYLIWYIKNRKLRPSGYSDKVTFIILVGAACFIYVRLTVAFLANFFLPSIIERRIDLFWLTVIVGLSSLFSVCYYMWRDVVSWVRMSDEKGE